MTPEIKKEILHRLSMCYKLFPRRRSVNYDLIGFQFDNDRHALIYEGGNMFGHLWGGSDLEMIKKVKIEKLDYDEPRNDFHIISFHRGKLSPCPRWLEEYSFKNENIKINWDDFFKQFDMFIIKYV